MAVTDYVDTLLTVANTPADADKAYYPASGAQWRLQLGSQGLYVFTPADQAAALPLHWGGSAYLLLEAGEQLDPEHPDVDRSQQRFYGIVLLDDRYFHVWFVERNGFECIARSVAAGVGTFQTVKNGGYNHG